METNERTKSAFEFAKESTIQLIGLSTGVITITMTFSKDLASGTDNPVWLLKASWAMYMLSICAGVMTLLAMTGTLSNGPDILTPKAVYGANVKLPSITQILSFLCATMLATLFAMLRS